MSSKRKKEIKETWGTPASYFPLSFPVARLEDEDIAQFQKLTPSQRIAWLLTMQKLIRLHYKSKNLKPYSK